MRKCIALIALGGLVAIAGCSRFSSPGTGQPSPLAPSPVGSVQSGQLDPAGQGAFPEAPTTTGPSEEELQQVAANAPEVTPESMVGGWTISTGGSSCDLFLVLTPFSGGYRAATRQCVDQAPGVIKAWNVQGNQVLLSDADGNQFAALYKTGEAQYSGATSIGQAVSLSRGQ